MKIRNEKTEIYKLIHENGEKEEFFTDKQVVKTFGISPRLLAGYGLRPSHIKIRTRNYSIPLYSRDILAIAMNSFCAEYGAGTIADARKNRLKKMLRNYYTNNKHKGENNG